MTFGGVSATQFHVLSDTSLTAIVPPGVPGAITLSVSAGPETSPLNHPFDYYVYLADTWTLYETSDQNTFLPIDISAPLPNPLAPILLSTPFLRSVAITPDGKTAYITNANTNFVLRVDLATGLEGSPIDIGAPGSSIAISPNGKFAYVVTDGAFIPIDLRAGTPLASTPLNPSDLPLMIALSPDGSRAYVTNDLGDSVSPIDLTTQPPTMGTPIAVGQSPMGIAIKPDGTTAYVVNIDANSVTPINLTTQPPTAAPPVLLGTGPSYIGITPDGQTAFITNAGGTSLTPLALNTTPPTPGTDVAVGIAPIGIAFTPDGKTAYIANHLGGTISSIDIAAYPPTLHRPFGASFNARSIVCTPDQAPVALFKIAKGSDRWTKTFDASASISPVGTIKSYAWDFGDGETAITNTPIISHTYSERGSYTISLKVTNSAGTSTSQVFTGQMVSRNGGPMALFSQNIQLTAVSPPTNVQGYQIKDHFLKQTDLMNVILWNHPSDGSLPTLYKIYRDAELTNLAAIIPALGELKYVDHNRHKQLTYSYFIVSVDDSGAESDPISIIVNPKK